ncbi:hypothetical protein BCV72DRAFT_186824, partial [Rhizopus microsporus var. microsporus]
MPKALPLRIQNDIKSAIAAGRESLDIAQELGITYATVNKYANKFFPNREKSKGGRPAVITARTKNYIK